MQSLPSHKVEQHKVKPMRDLKALNMIPQAPDSGLPPVFQHPAHFQARLGIGIYLRMDKLDLESIFTVAAEELGDPGPVINGRVERPVSLAEVAIGNIISCCRATDGQIRTAGEELPGEHLQAPLGLQRIVETEKKQQKYYGLHTFCPLN